MRNVGRITLVALLGLPVATCGRGGNPSAPTAAAPSPAAGAEDAEAEAAAVAKVKQTWSFTDNCSDNVGLRIRIFDRTDNRTRFPTTAAFYRTGSGKSVTRTIECQPGHLLCLGARPEGSGWYYWGVGFEGQYSCRGCCTKCTASRSPRWSLTCSNRASAFGGAGLSLEDGSALSSE